MATIVKSHHSNGGRVLSYPNSSPFRIVEQRGVRHVFPKGHVDTLLENLECPVCDQISLREIFRHRRANLAGYWNFDEASGDALEVNGWGIDGQLLNGLSRVSSIFGGVKALNFDGVDDVLNIPDHPWLDIQGALSITFKILGTGGSTAVVRDLVSKDTTGVVYNNNYLVRIDASRRPVFTIGNGSSEVSVTGNVLPASQVITHGFAFIYVPSVSMTIHVDSVQDAQLTSGVPAVAFTNSDPVRFGEWVNNRFTSIVDDFRIYRRALSAAEAKTHSSIGSVVNPAAFGEFYEKDFGLPLNRSRVAPDKLVQDSAEQLFDPTYYSKDMARITFECINTRCPNREDTGRRYRTTKVAEEVTIGSGERVEL